MGIARTLEPEVTPKPGVKTGGLKARENIATKHIVFIEGAWVQKLIYVTEPGDLLVS
jgi:hypothetical protein